MEVNRWAPHRARSLASLWLILKNTLPPANGAYRHLILGTREFVIFRFVFGGAHINDPAALDAFILGSKKNFTSLYRKIGQPDRQTDHCVTKKHDFLPSPIPISSQELHSNEVDFFFKSITSFAGNSSANNVDLHHQPLKDMPDSPHLKANNKRRSSLLSNEDTRSNIPVYKENDVSSEYSSPTFSQDFKSNIAFGLHRAGLAFSDLPNRDQKASLSLFKGCVICFSQRLWVIDWAIYLCVSIDDPSTLILWKSVVELSHGRFLRKSLILCIVHLELLIHIEGAKAEERFREFRLAKSRSIPIVSPWWILEVH